MKAKMTVLAVALGLFAPSSVFAAEYFVRTGGSDSACDGKSDVDQNGGGTCAFRTIEKCDAVAACGDTCNVADGFYAENYFEIDDSCSAGNEKVFRGAGRDRSYWMASMVDVDDTTCTTEGQPANVYRCNRPSGVRTNHLGQSVLQRKVTGVYGQDTSGRTVKWEMTGPVAVTWNTSSAASVGANEGHVFADTDYLYIRPWDDLDPNGSGTDFWAPLDCRGSDSNQMTQQLGLWITGSYITIDGFNVETGCSHGIQVGTLSGTASNIRLNDIAIHGGRLTFTTGTNAAYISNFEVTNGYRRNNDAEGVAGTWGLPSTSMMAVKGTDHVFEDGYVTAGRNCWGFTAATSGHTIRRVRADSCYNHNITVSDQSENILFQDSEFFNSQDFQISCARNLTIENSDIYTQLVVQDATCSDKSFARNIDVYNSWVCSFQFQGQTWENGGNDLDYNLYPVDHTVCFQGSGDQFKAGSGRFKEFNAWRNWSGDTCSDCTRDPNSKEETITDTFLNVPPRHDDSAPRNLDLKAGTKATNMGVNGRGSGKDIQGVDRVGRPDAGSYEYEQDGGAPNEPPSDVQGLRRTDTRK